MQPSCAKECGDEGRPTWTSLFELSAGITLNRGRHWYLSKEMKPRTLRLPTCPSRSDGSARYKTGGPGCSREQAFCRLGSEASGACEAYRYRIFAIRS